jgi:type I restriction enzyme S subunit
MIKDIKISVPNFENNKKLPPFCPQPTLKSPRWRKTRLPERREKALMQQLLTGKRRVKVDEAVAA